MSITIKQIGNTPYTLRYVNYRTRKMTDAERYEGYMRADFSTRKVPEFDSVEVIRSEGK